MPCLLEADFWTISQDWQLGAERCATMVRPLAFDVFELVRLSAGASWKGSKTAGRVSIVGFQRIANRCERMLKIRNGSAHCCFADNRSLHAG